MPAEGVPLGPKEDLLTDDEIIRLAKLFKKEGVTKIRLTGGEPTIKPTLVELVQQLSTIGFESIGMTSNGIALKRKLPALVQAGLTNLNLSLDTLDQFKFEIMTRRKGHSAVLESLQDATSYLAKDRTLWSRHKHLKSVKVNVVVIRNVNDSETQAFAELARDHPVEIRFIEYMPFDGERLPVNVEMTV